MSEVRTLTQLLDLLSRGYYLSDGCINPPGSRKTALEPKKCERSFCIAIAGHTVEIHSNYNEVYSLCEKYLNYLVPEIIIDISESDIQFEREQNNDNGYLPKDSYLETLSALRKISESMLAYNIFLMHGAVVAVNNEAFMFTADSGTGKTTHIKKWIDAKEDAFVVNGDKPLIQISGQQAIACGTPWCGKENMGTNTMVPLKAIVLMERGESNLIEEISFGQAYISLLKQSYRPSDPQMMAKTLDLISQLKGKVRFYKFIFNNMKDDAFPVAYNALTDVNQDPAL